LQADDAGVAFKSWCHSRCPFTAACANPC
jgi:hypothetical protein